MTVYTLAVAVYSLVPQIIGCVECIVVMICTLKGVICRSIGNMKKLQRLDVGNNEIEHLVSSH